MPCSAVPRVSGVFEHLQVRADGEWKAHWQSIRFVRDLTGGLPLISCIALAGLSLSLRHGIKRENVVGVERTPSLASGGRSASFPRMNRDGQTDGLQQVILNERARLLRFLAARGAGDEAEDVLHDLWQRVSAANLQPIADPVSYLFRAAENLMRDRRRSNHSREKRQQDWHETRDADDEAPVGERVLIAREMLRSVEDTLATLDPRAQTVFRRFRLEGVSQTRIAHELGVSLSSVEKDLQKAYRALARLKAQFDAE